MCIKIPFNYGVIIYRGENYSSGKNCLICNKYIDVNMDLSTGVLLVGGNRLSIIVNIVSKSVLICRNQVSVNEIQLECHFYGKYHFWQYFHSWEYCGKILWCIYGESVLRIVTNDKSQSLKNFLCITPFFSTATFHVIKNNNVEHSMNQWRAWSYEWKWRWCQVTVWWRQWNLRGL